MTSCTVTCVLLSVSGPEGENQNTFCIINLQIFLANSTQILYTKDRDSIHLSEIKRKEYTLVLRYSTQCCSTCVEDILRKMRKFEEQYPDIDILLFTTYRVQIEKKDFQRICRFFPKVYNVFSLGIPLDEEVVPYLFVLDRGMRVIDTFIPDKDLPKLTNRYFERITTTLSRNKAYNYKYYKKEI